MSIILTSPVAIPVVQVKWFAETMRHASVVWPVFLQIRWQYLSFTPQWAAPNFIFKTCYFLDILFYRVWKTREWRQVIIVAVEVNGWHSNVQYLLIKSGDAVYNLHSDEERNRMCHRQCSIDSAAKKAKWDTSEEDNPKEKDKRPKEKDIRPIKGI